MTTIYHNPRHSKSRQYLSIIEEQKEDVTIIKYLDTPLTIEKLSEIITLLGIKPIYLARKNETIWKENYKNKYLTDQEVLSILSENPKRIERPFVIKGKKM